MVAVLLLALMQDDEELTLKSLSVIFVGYNEHQYVERTLNSLYATTRGTLEVIVYDDGSWPPLWNATFRSLSQRASTPRNFAAQLSDVLFFS